MTSDGSAWVYGGSGFKLHVPCGSRVLNAFTMEANQNVHSVLGIFFSDGSSVVVMKSRSAAELQYTWLLGPKL